MAALGGGRDGRQLCSVLCNLEDACYSQRAEQSRAGPLCAGPGSLITPHFLSLRGSQANLLARDLILVLAALCSPPCVIMLHKSEKHARRRRRMMEWDWGELSLALLCMYFVFSLCLKCFGTMCLPVKNVTFSAVDRRALQLWFWAKAGPKPRTRWTLFWFAVALWEWALTLPKVWSYIWGVGWMNVWRGQWKRRTQTTCMEN